MDIEEMAVEILSQLVTFVKDAAPAVWAMTRQKILMEGVWNLLFAIFLILCGVFLTTAAKRLKDKGDYDWGYLAFFAMIIYGASVVAIYKPIMYFFSTDYYVLKELFSLVIK